MLHKELPHFSWGTKAPRKNPRIFQDTFEGQEKTVTEKTVELSLFCLTLLFHEQILQRKKKVTLQSSWGTAIMYESIMSSHPCITGEEKSK